VPAAVSFLAERKAGAWGGSLQRSTRGRVTRRRCRRGGTGRGFTGSPGSADAPCGAPASSLSPRGTLARSRSSTPPRRCVASQGPRPVTTPTGCLPRGEDPIDVMAALAFATALHGLGHARARPALEGPSIGPRPTTCIIERATLLTFVPSCPARSSPCDPAVGTAGFLSWGCPKIALPSTRAEESTPGRSRALRRGLPHPPAFRPRGFAPPRRLAPLRPCGLVSSRCRSWGSPRFRRSRNRLSRSANPPFEAFPPPMSVTVSPPRVPSCPFHPAFAGAGLQGLAPSSGPLCDMPFPARRTRCSHGLGWFIAPTVLRRIPRPR